MKPQARVQAVIDILEQSHIGRVPLDRVVGDYMRNRRYIGSKDRANIAERVYGLTRAHARLGWWMNQHKMDDTPRSRILSYLALIEGSDAKYIGGLCDASKYAPEPLSEDERAYLNTIEGQDIHHTDMPVDVRVECPPDHADTLKSYFGDAFETEMSAMIPGATLDLRVNLFKCTPEKAQAALEAADVLTDPTPYSPWGLRARGKAFLARTKPFIKGWIEIQDEGSQLIAHMCDVKPGMQVLDFCAGGGGKTLALASAMMRKGRIVAMDNDERRLAKGKPRYKKASIADIIEIRPLSDTKQAKWLKRQKDKFDVTLCDVPCSGTGTWRRNPDMRWRNFGPNLADLKTVQAEILDRVAHTVKPNGRLVYATCSLLPEENEEQIEAFLKRHDNFEVLPVEEARGLGTPFMRLTPHRHSTDGFFAAVLMKIK